MTRRAADEGSLYQSPRDSGRWFAAIGWRDASGKRRRRKRGPYGTRRAAAVALSDLQRLAASGLRLDLRDQTVGQYLDAWLHGEQRVPFTQRSYETLVRLNLLPALGTIPLGKLRAEHVRRMLSDMRAAGAGVATQAGARRVLHTAMEQAVADRVLEWNPVKPVKKPSGKARDYIVLDEAQVGRLLEAAGDEPLSALVAVATGLGLRQGEVLGLRWGDIDYDTALAHIRVQLQRYDRAWHLNPLKGGVARTLPLPPFVAGALRHRRAAQLRERARHANVWNNERGLVFTTPLGEPLHTKGAWIFFKDCLKRAGLPEDMRPHDQRHTLATQFAKAGVPEVAASAFFGHKNSATTRDIYTHVRADMMEAAGRASEEAFGRAPSGAP